MLISDKIAISAGTRTSAERKRSARSLSEYSFAGLSFIRDVAARSEVPAPLASHVTIGAETITQSRFDEICALLSDFRRRIAPYQGQRQAPLRLDGTSRTGLGRQL